MGVAGAERNDHYRAKLNNVTLNHDHYQVSRRNPYIMTKFLKVKFFLLLSITSE